MKSEWHLWQLPFFDARHEEVVERLNVWISQNRGLLAEDAGGSLEQQCAHWLASLARADLLRYAVPSNTEEHGDGLQVDLRSVCLVRECLSYYAPLADFVFSMQGIGAAPLWLRGGPQFAPYVQACLRGDKVAAFALTEPDGGSDVAATQTTATLDGDTYTVQGAKSYISNGGIADFYVVVARTEETKGAGGLSAILVDADTPGVRIHRRIDVIAPHPLAEIHFDACRVPASHLIGGAGDGFKVAMSVLDIFRSSVGAAAMGIARRALDETTLRMTSRTLFGKPMSEMDVIRHKVADMAVDLDSGQLMVLRAAWTRDVYQRRITTEAAMAKLHGTEAASRVVDAAVQLWGGMGITTGSVVERLYRDIRPMRIYEGASEVQRTIIGRALLRGTV